MFTTIIEKEIRELVGSTKFISSFVLCAVLIVLAFYAGAGNYRSSMAHHDASVAENLRQMEGLTDWLEVRQHRIFLPPSPLAALVSGVSNDIGRTTEVEGRGELKAHDSKFNEEPVFAVFRFVDLEFIFQIVLSLFAILLGYNAISGEKEAGTLKLALSNAVPRSTYILGKTAGLFVTLTVALLAAMLIGALILPLLGIPMTGDDWTRLGLIVLCGLLYFGAFLTLSIFVSSLTRRSSSSFLVLLVIWIVSVLIVPRVSVLMAGRAVDVPSVDELASQKGSFAQALWQDFREGMSSFNPGETDDIEVLMKSFNGYMDSLTAIRDDRMDEYSARLNEQRRNAQAHQRSVAFALARVSPGTSLTLATSELAGTTIDLKQRYHEAATEYQQEYAAFMTEKTGMNAGGGMIVFRTSDEAANMKDTIDPTEIPVFTFNNPDLSRSLAAALPDMGLLLMFNALFLTGALLGFSRYDVR